MQINVVGPKFDPDHDMSLFTTLDEDTADVVRLEERDLSMAHLLARLGKFASIGDAKRNGWDKPIPTGWHEFVIGKGAKRWDIWLWNPSTTQAEWDAVNGG